MLKVHDCIHDCIHWQKRRHTWACWNFQKLQRELEFLQVQEEYIKDEQKNLKKEYLHAQEEVKRIQSVPLVIGQFLEAVDQNTGIVGSTTGKCDACY